MKKITCKRYDGYFQHKKEIYNIASSYSLIGLKPLKVNSKAFSTVNSLLGKYNLRK
jgi:hypothetical protein